MKPVKSIFPDLFESTYSIIFSANDIALSTSPYTCIYPILTNIKIIFKKSIRYLQSILLYLKYHLHLYPKL